MNKFILVISYAITSFAYCFIYYLVTGNNFIAIAGAICYGNLVAITLIAIDFKRRIRNATYVPTVHGGYDVFI